MLSIPGRLPASDLERYAKDRPRPSRKNDAICLIDDNSSAIGAQYFTKGKQITFCYRPSWRKCSWLEIKERAFTEMSQSQQQTQIVNITTLSPEDLARLIKILIAEFGYSQQGTEGITDDKYHQSQSADEILSKEISESSASGMRSAYTIEYFPKDIDHNPEIVCKTLGNLGFNVHLEEAIVQDVPTNAIWFGSQVSVDDVKLVAYTLIRAGLDIKTIKPFRHRADGDDRSKLIQIGADADYSESPGLSVGFIRDQGGFYRND